MPSANPGAVGRRTTLAAAIALSISSVPTHAAILSVDGDLSDLIAVTGDNIASGTESGSDGENNGFDITDMYAHYDIGSDTFYIGMSMFGQVGTSGGDEGDPFAQDPYFGWLPDSNGAAGIFDGNESYGFSLYILGNPNNPTFRLDLAGDGATDGESVASLINPYGATFSWAVSEANNGVEFSITGLATQLGNFSYSNPTDVTINYFAGSISNTGAEDTATLNMQVIPVPAAVWLLGSGLLGLFGAGRFRRT